MSPAPTPMDLDKNMAPVIPGGAPLVWHHPYAPPFRLSGFAWFAQDKLYRRLPESVSPQLRDNVRVLANHSAGGQVSFRTDTREVAVRAILHGPSSMDSMPPTGQCGFDLYASTPGGLRFAGVTRFGRDATEYAAVLLTPDDERPDVLRGYTLNFPLYQGVREVQIGLTPGAAVEAPEPWALPGPIVAYGTSITQGGCASRPGMAWTNILSRRLNADVINLGFSGNGKGDRPVAEAMREIPSPVLFILDYETNTTMAELRATMPVFVDCLRERHPRIPILVVSKLAYPVERFHPCHIARRTQGREFLEALVADRKRAGDHRLFFLDGATLTGPEDHEWTVDGVHPTDVGFVQIAAGMERKVRAVLGGPSATA